MQEKVPSTVGFASFLFLPMLSLIIVIKNYREKWAKNIVWAFTAFYAYHFSAPNEGADINSYIGKFYRYSNQNFTIPNFIASLYAEDSKTLDVIEPLISYLTSQVTSDHKILLLLYGIIYGFFFSRNVWFFIDKTRGKLKLQAISVLVLFVVQIGIWQLNGFRFWCAAQIYIYAVIHIFFVNKIKGYLFLISSALMHLGMLLPILILILFRLIKLPTYFFFIFYCITFFLVELDLSVVREAINNYAPAFVTGKLDAYTSEAYVEVLGEKLDNYSVSYKITKLIRSGLVLFFIITLYLNRSSFKENKIHILFPFFLLLGGIANIVSQIPSGGRYVILSDFVLYGLVFYFLQNNSRFKLSQAASLLMPVILLYAFYNFRIIGIHTFTIHHFINNPFVSLFIY